MADSTKSELGKKIYENIIRAVRADAEIRWDRTTVIGTGEVFGLSVTASGRNPIHVANVDIPLLEALADGDETATRTASEKAKAII